MTSAKPRWLAVTLGAALAACGAEPPDRAALGSATLHADLETVARSRVLFGHQSVGRNVLAGVAELAADNGVPLRIEAIDGAPADGRAGLFHTQIGVNGDPIGKIDAFRQLLVRPERPRYDAALMELCYLDFGSEAKGPTDLAGLARHYAQIVRELGVARPEVQLVHVSVPLRADPPGWKTPLKRLLGRDTDEDADNALRNAYNASFGQAFAAAPFFDLARVESTRPDGRRSGFRRGGVTVYTLAPEYTVDGGHLNEGGRRRAAAAFVHALADALRRAPQG